MASNYPNDPVLSVDWRCTTWLRYGWKSNLKLKLRTKNNTVLSCFTVRLPSTITKAAFKSGHLYWGNPGPEQSFILEVTSLKEKRCVKSWLILLCHSDGVDKWHSGSPLVSSPTLLHTLSDQSRLRVSPRWEHTNTHGRYYTCTHHRGTCCCKHSCLFIAQIHTYLFATKITMPYTVPHTQLLGWWVGQLFTLWTLSDVQSNRVLHAVQY